VAYLVVALGGAIGAVLRWAVGEAVPPGSGSGIPWATLSVNVTGSFALALLPGSVRVRRQPLLVLALGPGVLGGYTTLSAYAEETRALLAQGDTVTALVYLVGTLGACLAAVALAAGLHSLAADDEFAAEGGDE
jgi:CrcB protein